MREKGEQVNESRCQPEVNNWSPFYKEEEESNYLGGVVWHVKDLDGYVCLVGTGGFKASLHGLIPCPNSPNRFSD